MRKILLSLLAALTLNTARADLDSFEQLFMDYLDSWNSFSGMGDWSFIYTRLTDIYETAERIYNMVDGIYQLNDQMTDIQKSLLEELGKFKEGNLSRLDDINNNMTEGFDSVTEGLNSVVEAIGGIKLECNCGEGDSWSSWGEWWLENGGNGGGEECDHSGVIEALYNIDSRLLDLKLPIEDILRYTFDINDKMTVVLDFIERMGEEFLDTWPKVIQLTEDLQIMVSGVADKSTFLRNIEKLTGDQQLMIDGLSDKKYFLRNIETLVKDVQSMITALSDKNNFFKNIEQGLKNDKAFYDSYEAVKIRDKTFQDDVLKILKELKEGGNETELLKALKEFYDSYEAVKTRDKDFQEFQKQQLQNIEEYTSGAQDYLKEISEALADFDEELLGHECDHDGVIEALYNVEFRVMDIQYYLEDIERYTFDINDRMQVILDHNEMMREEFLYKWPKVETLVDDLQSMIDGLENKETFLATIEKNQNALDAMLERLQDKEKFLETIEKINDEVEEGIQTYKDKHDYKNPFAALFEFYYEYQTASAKDTKGSNWFERIEALLQHETIEEEEEDPKPDDGENFFKDAQQKIEKSEESITSIKDNAGEIIDKFLKVPEKMFKLFSCGSVALPEKVVLLDKGVGEKNNPFASLRPEVSFSTSDWRTFIDVCRGAFVVGWWMLFIYGILEFYQILLNHLMTIFDFLKSVIISLNKK